MPKLGESFDPENDSIIVQEARKIANHISLEIENWLINSGVDVDNYHEFELEYDILRQRYQLRRAGEKVSSFTVRYVINL